MERVVVCLRLSGDNGIRRRNLNACLEALRVQTVPRQEYRVVVVEDGPEPLGADAPADEYLFRWSAKPFNRGRALNEGARACGEGMLCLMDADVLVDARWVERLRRFAGRGPVAVLPYEQVAYLTAEASEQAVRDREHLAGLEVERRSTTARGGALWITSDLFWQVGGYCERYVGWGCEDDDLAHRLARRAWLWRIAGQTLWHLWHPKAPRGPEVDSNLARYRQRWGPKAAARTARRTHTVKDPLRR